MRFRSFVAFGVVACVALGADDKTDTAKARKALHEVSDFVGEWNGNAESKAGGRNTLWKENYSWSWKFKDGDAWIVVKFNGGKHFKSGDLHYLAARKVYRLTAKDVDDKERVFEGVLKRGRLELSRTDAKTGDVYKITINTAAEGVRFVLNYEVQTGGKGLFSTIYKSAANKEGESLAASSKKAECIITGGLGTIPVTYMGKTYTVCCTGCRDEFNENPKKYVDAYEKKKK
ncbi:MAG TPA: YHS domain-containing protein [Fimbriiglobus sp.]